MPYTSTGKLYHMFGKKVSKYLMYRRAKRLFSEINRDISVVEARSLKSRGGHA